MYCNQYTVPYVTKPERISPFSDFLAGNLIDNHELGYAENIRRNADNVKKHIPFYVHGIIQCRQRTTEKYSEKRSALNIAGVVFMAFTSCNSHTDYLF